MLLMRRSRLRRPQEDEDLECSHKVGWAIRPALKLMSRSKALVFSTCLM